MAERKIPNKLFFKIGEVCELTDIQPYVLRYWETEFPTLAPAKNSSGQRIYRRRDIETVIRIKELLYGEGFTVAGARKKIEQEQSGRVDTPVSPAALDSAFEGEPSPTRRSVLLLRPRPSARPWPIPPLPPNPRWPATTRLAPFFRK
jgi:DNA-binding transcriptional MerR regulator